MFIKYEITSCFRKVKFNRNLLEFLNKTAEKDNSTIPVVHKTNHVCSTMTMEMAEKNKT